MKKGISIIIVNYNTEQLLSACLEKVYASDFGDIPFEVIVVDNASTDGSPETVRRKYPGVMILVQAENTGFAKANNAGIRQSKFPFVLLLNSDTEVAPDAIRKAGDFLAGHPKAAAVTGMLVLGDGTMDPACHRGFPTPWASFTYLSGLEKIFPRHPWFSGYHLGWKDRDTDHEVDVISGAFFLVRREAIEQVGLLDESYFMYAEDIDWCYRLKQAGWEIWFYPASRIIHRKKQSGRRNARTSRRLETDLMFHENNLRFFRKWYSGSSVFPLRLLIESVYWLKLSLIRLRMKTVTQNQQA